MFKGCAVEQDLRRYERQQDDDESRDMAIEALAAEKMLPGGSCDLTDKENISEAECEIESHGGDATPELIEDYLRKKADEEAEEEIYEIEQNACPRCGGRGCGRCEPD